MSHAIKLSGKFEVEFPIDIDKSYKLALTGGVNSIAKHSNEDGTFEYVYNVKPEFGEVIKENGQVLKIKRKGSQSQKLRFQIQDRGLDYEKTMSSIIEYLPEILEVIKQ